MVEIKNYCKSIKSRPILNNVSYNFEYGKIYGIYGHNGSGKTMLLRAIAGLLVPDSGSVVIDGKVLHKDMSFPPSIGIVIENMNLLPQYNAFDNLKILGKIKKTATDEDIKTALERVGLKSDLKVKKFSLGMKQRLNIAQAVFEKQKIILLDEPTNALDNDGVQLIYKLLKEEKERGALVVITTHHKEDLEEICDVVLKMTEGELHESKLFTHKFFVVLCISVAALLGLSFLARATIVNNRFEQMAVDEKYSL